MTEDDVREYLKAQYESRLEVLTEGAQMFASMFECTERDGMIRPVDMQTYLSTHKALIELSTLLRAYNGYFSDIDAIEIQRQVDPIIEVADRYLGEILVRVTKLLFPEKRE